MLKRRFLYVDDIHEITGWSKDRIRRLIRSGRLRSTNIGSGSLKPRYIIPVEEFERFMSPTGCEVDEPQSTCISRIDTRVEQVF